MSVRAGAQGQVGPPDTHLFYFVFVFFFPPKIVSLCSPRCPRTHSVNQAGDKLRDLPASAFQVLRLKMNHHCLTVDNVIIKFYKIYLIIFVWAFSLCVCLCTTCMPGAHRPEKGIRPRYDWCFRWFRASMWVKEYLFTGRAACVLTTEQPHRLPTVKSLLSHFVYTQISRLPVLLIRLIN